MRVLSAIYNLLSGRHGMENLKKTKILIIFIAGIGDLILFTPVLKGLLRHYENCEISIIVPPDLASCARKMQYFSEVIVSETSDDYNFFARTIQLLRLCFHVFRRSFDICITPLPVKCNTASLLSWLSRAGINIGYACDDYDLNRRIFTETIEIMPLEHDLLQNMKVLERLNIRSFDKKMEFYLSEEDRKDADTFLKNNGVSGEDILVAFHPTTKNRKGYNKRDWPSERFARLGSEIVRRYGAKIIIMGSREDRKIASEMKSFIGDNAIVQAGEISMHAAAAILERSALLVCNDSSLMHIGATMEVPMVSIWGPTKHVRRGYSGHNQIIIRKELSCSPCQREGKIVMPECDTRKCLKQIPVEKVFESCSEILSIKRGAQVKQDKKLSGTGG